MPIDIINIFSKVQSSIGDLSMDLYQPGEYIETVNRLAEKIARETEIWIARHIAVPNPLATAWVASTNYTNGQIVSNGGNYYYNNINHTSAVNFGADAINWTIINPWTVGTVYTIGTMVYIAGPAFYRCIQAHTATLSEEPPNIDYWEFYGYSGQEIFNVKLPYTFNSIELAPFRLIRVSRGSTGTYIDNTGSEFTGWNECHEYSQQTIARTISGNSSFDINRSILGQNQFLTQFVDNIGTMDGGINLLFGGSFYLNELCIIDFISGKPFRDNPLTMWDPQQATPVQIPDFLYDTFRWGLQWLVSSELFSRGIDRFGRIAENSRFMYQDELISAIAYSKKFKDNRSSLTLQPINWLPEEDYEQ